MKKKMVGTNYHPHDWTPEQWRVDLDMMKSADFSIVRVGHLCWDSFEPEEGNYQFEWMDEFLTLCYERDIKVFMDIPTRPAPIWLHKKFPSIDIVDKSGNRLEPNTRYMEDVGDPDFQRIALKLAQKIARRYKNHPALLAFGLCNELGSGFHSYSRTALKRFQKWLELQYDTIDNLNQIWNTKRWSRRYAQFSDIFFPVSGDGIKGSPEIFLDCERFFSDEILNYLKLLSQCVRDNAPGVPVSTNHWAENKNAGFDYQKNYQEVIDYSGIGFYPGINPEYEDGFIGSCMNSDHRVGEMDSPMWGLEFQTGTNGGYAAPKGTLRMYAYLSWVYRNEMVCSWTWRTMVGGEEQYFYGLLDHDGYPSRKYDEMKQLAKEWQFLNENDVKRKDNNQRIGIAYSFENSKVMQYAPNFYKTNYKNGEVLGAYKALFHKNLDCNLIDLRHVRKSYSVVIVPGYCLMDRKSADTIRHLVKDGTTVIMTGYSAKVDEHNQAFTEALPGYLSDVFGVRVRGFDRAISHVSTINEGGIEKNPEIKRLKDVDIKFGTEHQNLNIDYHEFLEVTNAETLAEYIGIDEDRKAAVTSNFYGQGRAIYVGIPANEQLISKILDELEVGTITNTDLPRGIVSRPLNHDSQIFINTTSQTIEIPIKRPGIELLTQSKVDNFSVIKPYDVKIIKYDMEMND
ncbi:beta-galactosidase [Enterococcus thailandicus]|uniref:beta-galactosidase n=1 Tax=Enterococcus thailandicus TaxID=417368 RepID=UPI0022E9104F|nr:beta-galactosidase [Enterococcus thailandicus]